MSPSFSLPLPNKNSVMNKPPGVDAPSACAQSAPGRNPNALDVLYITSTEYFLEDISKNLKEKAEKSNVPMEILYVEKLRGVDSKEKIYELKNCLKDFHGNGRIDEKTQIIINIHGSVSNGPHKLSNKNNNFSLSTMEMVDLIRNSKVSAETNVKSDVWEGTIHVGACGAGRAGPDLKEDAGMNLLYAGKNIKLGIDSEAIFSEIIRQLGEYRKDVQKNTFPTTQQFYEVAGTISGEKITLSGKGKLCHIRSTYLPPPADLVRQDVVDKLEKSLVAKLMHGKFSTVKKITELLGPLLKNIKLFDPLTQLACFGINDVEEKLKILIESGVDINQRFYNETTALHRAVQEGKNKNALLLIKYGADINAQNKIGETPLSTAILAEDIEMMECLIGAGADIDATDRDGNSALHVACTQGREDLVEMLLARGASGFAENHQGNSALQNAISKNHTNIIDLILIKTPQENFPGIGPSGEILLLSKLESAPQFLRKIIQKIPDRQSALSNLFNSLAEKIADNNERGMFDQSLLREHKISLNHLMRLMLESNESMPDYLKDYLAGFMSRRYEEYLPAILGSPNLGEKWSSDFEELRAFFAELGMSKVSDLFGATTALKSKLSEKIDPDLFQLYTADPEGLTPFQRSCRTGNIAELMILDNVIAELKFSRTSDGKSTLMLACEANSLEAVNWLLDKGVDRDLPDAKGKTALDYAIETGNTEIEQAIRTRFTGFN